MATEETYTIGKVVKQLSATYPDLTVSKVRFLESEGLITPRRTRSGYRMYTDRDVRRLETVLNLQTNSFLPLAVIKERLELAGDDDLLAAGDPTQADAAGAEVAEQPAGSEQPAFEPAGLYPLDDLPELLGVPAAFARALQDAGLVRTEPNEDRRPCLYGRDLPLVSAAYELDRYGIDPRFLKANVQHANREVPLFKQAILGSTGRMPALDDPEVRSSFDALLSRLLELSATVTDCLIRRDVYREFNYPVTAREQ
jgi:DNA-binding transcriptional MerR regulator